MPLLCGSTRPITALVAMAASTALPPRSRICTPARAASGWLAATMPYFVATFERPVTTVGRVVDPCWPVGTATRQTTSAKTAAVSFVMDIRGQSSTCGKLLQVRPRLSLV